MVHWNGQAYRFHEADLRMRSRIDERYGKDFLPRNTRSRIGAWHADLEPHYDRFEYLARHFGKAGNLLARRFPAQRARGAARARVSDAAAKGALRLGRCSASRRGPGLPPVPQPSANLSEPYTNPEGLTLKTCMFCGYCERYGCEHYAKSTPQTVLLPVLLKGPEVQAAHALPGAEINLDRSGRNATSVTYVDAQGRELEQPAALVIVGLFALNNVRMLLLSKIGAPYDPATGKGAVGKNTPTRR